MRSSALYRCVLLLALVLQALYSFSTPFSAQQSLMHQAFEQMPPEGDDQAAVLQKSLDLPALQPFLSKNGDGSFKTVYIMQHMVSFPGNIGVMHAGKPVVFIDKATATGGTTEAYLLFQQFEVQGNSAWVEFVCYYDQSTPAPKTQVISLKLQKAGTTWMVADSKIQGGQS